MGIKTYANNPIVWFENQFPLQAQLGNGSIQEANHTPHQLPTRSMYVPKKFHLNLMLNNCGLHTFNQQKPEEKQPYHANLVLGKAYTFSANGHLVDEAIQLCRLKPKLYRNSLKITQLKIIQPIKKTTNLTNSELDLISKLANADHNGNQVNYLKTQSATQTLNRCACRCMYYLAAFTDHHRIGWVEQLRNTTIRDRDLEGDN